MKKNDMLKINAANLVVMIFTVGILSLLMRFILPYGDEPDFTHRSFMLLNGDNFIADFLKLFYVDGFTLTRCESSFSASSITGSVDGFMCGESPSQKLSRWLLFNVFFLFVCAGVILYKVKDKSVDVERIRLSILLSFISPSILYFSGVFAFEQVALFASMFVIFFVSNIILYLFLAIFCFYLDPGYAMVLCVFYLYFQGMKIIYVKFGFLCFVFCLISSITISFVFQMDLLLLLSPIPIVGDKVQVIVWAYTESSYAEVVDKYPLYLRPVMTFMTFVFMTPNGVKFIPLYLLFFLGLCIAIFRFRSRKDDLVSMMIATSFIVCVVCILPGYSNAKYYVFLMPFFVKFTLNDGYIKTMMFFCVATLLLVFYLSFIRL